LKGCDRTAFLLFTVVIPLGDSSCKYQIECVVH